MNSSPSAGCTHDGAGTDHGLIASRTQRTWLDDDGIIHAASLPGSEQKGLDAVSAVAHMWEVAGRRRRPVLIDLRRAKAMDRDARSYYAGPQTAGNQIAVAIWIESPLSRILGNFFLGLNKPLMPTQLFTSEPAALAWLRGFVEPAPEPK